jgi:hypothetical protein
MPDIQLIKLSIRRGTDAQRQLIVLEQGELGYTTDHKRLWVGDGVLSGGNVLGAKIFDPLAASGGRLLQTEAHTGDLVYENNWMYQLTGTDYATASHWVPITTKPDEVYLQYDGNRQLTIIDNSITGDKFAASAAYNAGGLVATTNFGLSVVPDYSTIEVAQSTVRVMDDGINENKIVSSALYNGLSGGSGAKLQILANLSHFGYIGRTLQLSALPSGIVTFSSIDENIIGDGLKYDTGTSTIQANISGVGSTLQNSSGVVDLKTIVSGDTVPFAKVTRDNYGRVTASSNTIINAFTANDTSTSLSTFNGYPGQVSDGIPGGVTPTVFPAISAGGVAVSLSSAGFITIPSMVTSQNQLIDRVAIPVFVY